MGERRSNQISEALRGQTWAEAPPSMEERFWEKVDRTGDCWLWTSHIDKYGFGTWGYGINSRIQAHRYGISLYGDVPKRVVNLCGNKHCVRHDHWKSAKS
jgi:hypothetical protein